MRSSDKVEPAEGWEEASRDKSHLLGWCGYTVRQRCHLAGPHKDLVLLHALPPSCLGWHSQKNQLEIHVWAVKRGG